MADAILQRARSAGDALDDLVRACSVGDYSRAARLRDELRLRHGWIVRPAPPRVASTAPGPSADRRPGLPHLAGNHNRG